VRSLAEYQRNSNINIRDVE